MADPEGFDIKMQPHEDAQVFDLETGKAVDRPSIARRETDSMSTGMEHAGGTLSIDPDLEAQIESIDLGDIPNGE